MWNFGATEEISILDLARRIVKLAGCADSERVDSRIVFVPYDEAYGARLEDMRRRVPDVNRIRGLTGWEPMVRLDESLLSILACYRDGPGRLLGGGGLSLSASGRPGDNARR